MSLQVKQYWDIRNKQDLNKEVSVIANNTLAQYDVKTLDDNPSESEISILREFAGSKKEVFHVGWINDKGTVYYECNMHLFIIKFNVIM